MLKELSNLFYELYFFYTCTDNITLDITVNWDIPKTDFSKDSWL